MPHRTEFDWDPAKAAANLTKRERHQYEQAP